MGYVSYHFLVLRQNPQSLEHQCQFETGPENNDNLFGPSDMNYQRDVMKLKKGKPRYKSGPPEERAQRTKGTQLIGRITLPQYELLVGKGYDGDCIRKWTKYKASTEIAKVLNRKS